MDVPEMNFLMIDGKGDPNTSENFKGAIETLFSVAYTVKFIIKEEGPTISKLHTFIAESGLTRTGKHHEIYLSDIRRAAPEKWKTIVRQPVRQ